jgi:circadian clock protein KaiB
MKRNAQKKHHARLVLRLYVAGDSPNSVLARRNLQAAIGHLSAEDVSLKVIDVLREPLQALHDGVLITPMLVRGAPPSEHRLVGNLRGRAALVALLGLDEAAGG